MKGIIVNDLILSGIPISELEILIDNAVTRAIKRQSPPPAPAPQSNDYITRKQAAELLHCSLVSLHAWAKQGKIKLYHLSGKTLLRKSEVLAVIKPVSYSLNEKTR